MSRALYRSVVVCMLTMIVAPTTQAAPFVNLNFEQATVPPGTPPGTLPASLAFPGWTPRVNDQVISTVYYNFFGSGEPTVVLYDFPNSGLNLPVFEGSYSAAVIGTIDVLFFGSLSQIGDVPQGTRSIRLLSVDRRLPVLAVNGSPIPLVRLTGGLPIDAAVYGADVTSFAGSTVELRLISPVPPNGRIGGADAIVFSPDPIPEPPGTIAALFTSFTLARRLRRDQKGKDPCRKAFPNIRGSVLKIHIQSISSNWRAAFYS